MKLVIKQSGTKLKIYNESEKDFIFSEYWNMLLGVYKAKIFNPQKVLLYSIRKRFRLLKYETSYEIESSSGRQLILKSLNKKHSIFQLKFNNDLYQIKVHKGRDKSIFHNCLQIASI